MKKQLYVLVALLMAATMILTACGPAATAAPAAAAPTLPRNETMYFNGQQWGSVVCWNPYSSNCNNAMAISEGDSARVIEFETPTCMTCWMASRILFWRMVPGHGTLQGPMSHSSSKLPPSGAMAPR